MGWSFYGSLEIVYEATINSSGSEGKGHHAAVRGLAFKWIRIVFRCWTDRVVYDENKYLAALAKRREGVSSLLCKRP